MKRQHMGWILTMGLLAAAMGLLFRPVTGLIHSGPIALAGVGLLAAALFKHAQRPATHD